MNKRTKLTSVAIVLTVSLGLTGTAQGDLTWYNDQGDFESAMTTQGNVLDGTETFEENTYADGLLAMLSDPLESGVPAGSFPAGLDATNLIVQSNTLGGNSSTPSPRGANALFILTEGAGFGESSDIVMPNFFLDSIDLIFTDAGKTGVGFDAICYMWDEIQVRVYDKNDVFLGVYVSPADMGGTHFIGVSADVPIGRINIYDGLYNMATQSGDNIQMWSVPEPATIVLLALSVLALRRRG